MYANLEVTIDGAREPVYAWKVEVSDAGTVIFKDANDGEDNYAVPDGTMPLPPGARITITASF